MRPEGEFDKRYVNTLKNVSKSPFDKAIVSNYQTAENRDTK